MRYFSILLVFFLYSIPAYANLWLNLIPNAGFEKDLDRNNIPDHWYFKKNQRGILKLESNGKKGRCISILGKGACYCEIRNLQTNRFYILSLWIKRDGWKEGEYPKIKIFGKEFHLNNIISWGSWIKITLLLNSNNKNKTTLFLINPGIHHKIYFDEISLREFVAKAISPSGNIYTCFPEFIWSIPENHYILDAEIEISRKANFRSSFIIKKVKSPSGNRIRIDFPIDGGRWFWRVKIYKNGRLITISKPLSFNILGFFPIGIYGVPVEYFDVVKKAGFNSICLSGNSKSIKKILSYASKYSLRLLLSIPYDIWEKDLTGFFKNIKYSPDILAWYLVDEPEIKIIPPLYIWRLKRYIKTKDSFHPTLITLVRAKMVEDYGEGADIIMVDPYPIPRRSVTWLSESIDEIKRVFPYKPVWAVIQAFDWSAFPYGDEKREWGRDPTYKEKRCLTYLAIVHGARGLFYFTFKNKKYFIMNRTQHWNELKSIIQELNSIYSLLISPKIFPAESVAISQSGKIHYIIKHVLESTTLKKGYYILCVNTSSQDINARLRLPFSLNAAEEIFEKRKIRIKNNWLQDHFSSYEVHVYFISLKCPQFLDMV